MLTSRWRKSGHSNSNGCLEAAWHRSSWSYQEANCTEAALRGGTVLVRDSKDPDGPKLAFSPADWDAFLQGVKAA